MEQLIELAGIFLALLTLALVGIGPILAANQRETRQESESSMERFPG